jgi:MFS family permease
VAAVGVLLACVSGFGFYSLTIYVSALTDAFSLGTVSRASALFLITSGLGGTLVGWMLLRVDIRMVLAGGGLLMAAGLALLGQVSSAPGLYGAYFLLGLGQAGAGIVPGLTLVTRWFDAHRRKSAMTFASTGLSVGGIAIAPVVALGLRHHSLASVTAVAALTLAALCVVAVLAITPFPTALAERSDDALTEGLTRAQALRTRDFWVVSGTQTCATFAQVGGLTHLFSLVSERGSAAVAGEAISAVAVGSLSGRFLGGYLLARTSTLSFYRFLLLLQSAALLSLAVGHGTGTLLVTSAVFGFTIGNILLSHPLLLGELFGQRDFARVLALSTLIATVGTALGPVVVGQLRSSTGAWSLPYVVAATGSLAGAALLVLFVRSPASPPLPVSVTTLDGASC